jgi:hypothetical protein
MPATMAQTQADPESLIMFMHPSIGADAPGRLIGKLMNLVPLPFAKHVKLSALILGLPLAPIGLLLYFLMKVFGERYVLTTHAIQIWSSIGQRLEGAVALEQIAEITVNQRSGQEFFHAADLAIVDRAENEVLTLQGVPRAEVFRQTILKARDARVQVSAALKTISARAGH